MLNVKYGLCGLHYGRLRASGEPGDAKPKRVLGDDEARFWSYVDKRGPDDCWPWTGAATKGRGYFYAGGKLLRATRYLLGVLLGADLEGLDACHSCDNPNCMNPAHLFPGTRLDNVRDMDLKGRRVNGHAKVTPEFVTMMRALYDSGRTPIELAETFGVNYHTMYSIVRRQTWKNLT